MFLVDVVAVLGIIMAVMRFALKSVNDSVHVSDRLATSTCTIMCQYAIAYLENCHNSSV